MIKGHITCFKGNTRFEGRPHIKQILVINSLVDQRFSPFFEKVFATIGVGTVWEDYENIGRKTSRDSFQKTVEASHALFLVLSQGAQTSVKEDDLSFLKSDFVKEKEIFVFEHCEDIKRISIRVPRVSHYFSMYITNAWTGEVMAGASAFEALVPSSAAMSSVKLERFKPEGVENFFSAATGMALFDFSTSRPATKKVVCPQCTQGYVIHIPADMRILRCPVCRQFCEMQIQVSAGAVAAEPVAS